MINLKPVIKSLWYYKIVDLCHTDCVRSCQMENLINFYMVNKTFLQTRLLLSSVHCYGVLNVLEDVRVGNI